MPENTGGKTDVVDRAINENQCSVVLDVRPSINEEKIPSLDHPTSNTI